MSERKLERWNYKTRNYETLDVPEDATIMLLRADLDEDINCASCGRMLTVRESFNSIEIENAYGDGYAICADCHKEEIERLHEDMESADGYD